VRPLNYVPGTPGQGFVRVETVGGKRVLVLNALGRLFMEPTDDPFGAIDRLLGREGPSVRKRTVAYCTRYRRSPESGIVEG
jgi:calcineurin-like phosphoesterase